MINRRAFITAIAAALGLRGKAKASPPLAGIASFDPAQARLAEELRVINPAWALYHLTLRAGYPAEELDIASFEHAAAEFDRGVQSVALAPLLPRSRTENMTWKEENDLWEQITGTFTTAPEPTSP